MPDRATAEAGTRNGGSDENGLAESAETQGNSRKRPRSEGSEIQEGDDRRPLKQTQIKQEGRIDENSNNVHTRTDPSEGLLRTSKPLDCENLRNPCPESCATGARLNGLGGLAIKQIAFKIQQTNADFDCKTESDEKAVFLGGTGSGKSTIINFLCDVPIVAISKRSRVVFDVDEKFQGKSLKIGHQASKTKSIDMMPIGENSANKNLLCCDMPGSSDTNELDRLANSILRARTFQTAHAVLPVVVIGLDGFSAERFQPALTMLRYVSTCFQDTISFKNIHVIITKVLGTDLETVERLHDDFKSIQEQIPELGDIHPATVDLIAHLEPLLGAAVKHLEAKQTLSNSDLKVRVVRPDDQSAKSELVAWVTSAKRIPKADKAFAFSLEDTAKSSIQRAVAYAQNKVTLVMTSTYKYEEALDVLQDLQVVDAALKEFLPKEIFVKMSAKSVQQANAKLFDDIFLKVKSLLASPEANLDLGELSAELQRFHSMQVLMCESTKGVLPDWKASQDVLTEYVTSLRCYIADHSTMGWRAMSQCYEAVSRLARVMFPEESVELQATAGGNIDRALSKCSAAVDLFVNAFDVTDALDGLHQASSEMTGEEWPAKAASALEAAKARLHAELQALLETVCDQAELEKGESAADAGTAEALQRGVMKLFQFSREGQRMDAYLPAEFRSDSKTGYYSAFKERLRLDEAREASRAELLQHFRLLSALYKVDDDDLQTRIAHHMTLFKAEVDSLLQGDLSAVEEAFRSFDQEPVECDFLVHFASSAAVSNCQRFQTALLSSLELLDIDEIAKTRPCYSSLRRFFESRLFRYLERMSLELQGGLDSPAKLISVFNVLTLRRCWNHCELTAKISHAQNKSRVESLVVEAETKLKTFNETALSAIASSCAQMQVLMDADDYPFGTQEGLERADSNLAKLDCFAKILAMDDNVAQRAFDAVMQRYQQFVQARLCHFKDEMSKGIKCHAGCVLKDFQAMFPRGWSRCVAARPEPSLFQGLLRDVEQLELEVIELTRKPRLEHKAMAQVSDTLKALKRWRQWEMVNELDGARLASDDGGRQQMLADALDRLYARISKAAEDAVAAFDKGNFDVAADFLKNCHGDEDEKQAITVHIETEMRNHIAVLENSLDQIAYIEDSQAKQAAACFDLVKKCAKSKMIYEIDEGLLQAVNECVDNVTRKFEAYSGKFKSELEKRKSGGAYTQYSAVRSCLRGLAIFRSLVPEKFQQTFEIFEDHCSSVLQLMNDAMEASDIQRLQRTAVDTVKICSELSILTKDLPPVFFLMEEIFDGFRIEVGTKMVEIFKGLVKWASSIIQGQENCIDQADNVFKCLDVIKQNLERAQCNPEYIASINYEKEKQMLKDSQRKFRRTLKSNLHQGTYAAIAQCIASLRDDELENAISDVKEYGENLLSSPQGGPGDLNIKGIHKLKELIEIIKEIPHLEDAVMDLSQRLAGLDEDLSSRLDGTQAAIAQLVGHDVHGSALCREEWNDHLRRLLSLKNSSMHAEVLRKIVDSVAAFAVTIRQKQDRLLRDLAVDAQGTDWNVLVRLIRNLQSGSQVLGALKSFLEAFVGQPAEDAFPVAHEDFAKQVDCALQGKRADVIAELRAGLKDTTKVSALLSTLASASKFTLFQDLDGLVREAIQILRSLADAARASYASRRDDWSDHFNRTIGVLKAGEVAFQHLPEFLQIASELQLELESPVRKEVQEIIAEYEETDGQIPNVGEMANAVLQMRELATKVDSLHSFITKEIARLLNRFKSSVAFMISLGEALMTAENPLGQHITRENPDVFQRLSNMMFNQCMKDKATMDVDQVIRNLLQLNPQLDVEAENLKGMYVKYQETMDALIAKFIKNVTKPLERRRLDLVEEIKKQVALKGKACPIQFLAHICAALAFCRSAEYYGNGKDDDSIVQPHPIQVISILRMIGITLEPVNYRVFWKNLKASSKIENHMMQIPTGEGKSIVLGVTACFFLLRGYSVDCVCFSKYLSCRDQGDFSGLFELLREVVDSREEIRYLTFEELCESHIRGIRKAVDDVIAGQDVHKQSDPRQQQRILLIDEADVFFTKRFYGNSYSPGTLLRSPEVTALIHDIWSARSSRRDPSDVLLTPAFQAVLARFPSIEALVRQTALSLATNVGDMDNLEYKWTISKGRIGYVDGGEFKDARSFRHQNRTVFAFLSELERGTVPIAQEDLDAVMGFEVKCGAFSYANLPKRYYSKIFGVTGTLQTLTAQERGVLETEYDVRRWTLIPSSFGVPRLDYDTANKLHLAAYPSVAEWTAKIDASARDAVGAGRAVLICFKNDAQLRAFQQACPRYDTAKVLNSHTQSSDVDYINGVVANATMPRSVTLLSRKFGRGLDFKASKQVVSAGGVLVVQTFFSSSESEEVQVKGRTARQGETGSYRLLLCDEHLNAKFGLADASQLPQDELREALTRARESRCVAKFDARAELKVKAEKLDQQSWDFRDALYTAAPAPKKLELLSKLSLACSAAALTFLFLLDVSGSMSPHWAGLKGAFHAFVQAVRGSGHGTAGSVVTVVAFDNGAETLFADSPVAGQLALPARMPRGGGTSFRVAFAQCKAELEAKLQRSPSSRFHIVFMTDGEDGGSLKPADLEASFRGSRDAIAGFHSIAFGRAAAALGSLGQAFENLGVPSRCSQPQEALELVQAFEAVAADARLHM